MTGSPVSLSVAEEGTGTGGVQLSAAAATWLVLGIGLAVAVLVVLLFGLRRSRVVMRSSRPSCKVREVKAESLECVVKMDAARSHTPTSPVEENIRRCREIRDENVKFSTLEWMLNLEGLET